MLPEARVREDRFPLGRGGRVLVARHRPREPLFRDGELDGHVPPFPPVHACRWREHATGSQQRDAGPSRGFPSGWRRRRLRAAHVPTGRGLPRPPADMRRRGVPRAPWGWSDAKVRCPGSRGVAGPRRGLCDRDASARWARAAAQHGGQGLRPGHWSRDEPARTADTSGSSRARPRCNDGLVLIAGGTGDLGGHARVAWAGRSSRRQPPMPPSRPRSSTTRRPTRYAPTGSMTHPRAFHSATLLADGRVLIVGGGCSHGSGEPRHGSPDAREHPATRDLRSGDRDVQPREREHGHPARDAVSATVLQDGRVLIAGGVTAPADGLASPHLTAPRAAR